MRTAEELSDIINGCTGQIINSLSERNIEPYNYLKQNCTIVNVFSDEQYRSTFRSYYTLRFPSKQWINRFFELFQQQKKTPASFVELSRELFVIDGTHQFSFITKMLHTIDDSYPVFDYNIGKSFGFHRHAGSIAQRITEDECLVRYMMSTYARMESQNLINSAIQAFDRKFPGNGISFIKKADFLLWKCKYESEASNLSVLVMDLKPGRYRHFKGNEYKLLYTSTHSETMEMMVVYRALYGKRQVWVRPAFMWNEEVIYNGARCRRFTYIGE